MTNKTIIVVRIMTTERLPESSLFFFFFFFFISCQGTSQFLPDYNENLFFTTELNDG